MIMSSFMDETPAILPLVVIDGANVAHAFSRAAAPVAGAAGRPDARGVAAAARELQRRGHFVAIVLPMAYEQRAGFAAAELAAACLAAPMTQVVYAPVGDDLFCIALAQRHDGFVLSNDHFRAEAAEAERRLGAREAGRLRDFLQRRLISFAVTPQGEVVLQPLAAAAAAASERAEQPFEMPRTGASASSAAAAPAAALPQQHLLPLQPPWPSSGAAAAGAGAGADDDMSVVQDEARGAAALPAALGAPAAPPSAPGDVPEALAALAAQLEADKGPLARLVLARIGPELVAAVSGGLHGAPTVSLDGLGASPLSLAIGSEAALCEALARLAVERVFAERTRRRLAGGAPLPDRAAAEAAARALWSVDSRCVLRDGLEALLRRPR